MARAKKRMAGKLITSDFPGTISTGSTQKGLVFSKRGKNGGVLLARRACEISVYDLAEAVDGATMRGHCVMGLRDCSHVQPCELHDLWQATRDPLIARMKTLTLADLGKGHDFNAATCRDIHRNARERAKKPGCGCCGS